MRQFRDNTKDRVLSQIDHASVIKVPRFRRSIQRVQNDVILCEEYPARRRSLRIAVVTETWPPEVNGVARTIARFVQGLRELDHEIQLVRPHQGPSDRARAGDEDLLVRGVPLPVYAGLRMGLPARMLLTRMWSRRRPDVVHVVTEGPLGWSALQAAARLDIPLTSDFRTNFDAYSSYYGAAWLKKPIAAYLRKFHNRTMITTAPTASLRRRLLALGYRNVQVLARGVDASLFDPARRSDSLRWSWGATADTPVIGYVGRLAPEKNLPLLVAAFREIRSRHGSARLVLVGDGPRVYTLSAEPGVIRAGVRSGAELASYYASFDFFLFPSVTETFGNVTLEAMASGLPIVAYDYAASAEYIENGVTGLLAEYDNAQDFIEQSLRLVASPGLAARFRIGIREAATRLDWRCVVGRMEAILFSAAESRAVDHASPPPGKEARAQRAAC